MVMVMVRVGSYGHSLQSCNLRKTVSLQSCELHVTVAVGGRCSVMVVQPCRAAEWSGQQQSAGMQSSSRATALLTTCH